ncbi:HNH endonuclease [Aequorivita sediminis]|uniref:HNH endonuclease n=1 Tax=Aequorivita sediminis TaxID=3073653 RepID=UPI0028AF62BA|nr:HNH endonuclease [Aequorivita sp. F6058]
MNSSIEKYINYFLKLNRGYNKGLGFAPHKPIMLLSVIELIGKGIIETNKVFITPELVLAFKNNWNKLVITSHTSNFSLPFFHLRSEPFWRLATHSRLDNMLSKSKSIKSFKALKENVAFAEIDRELFLLLSDNLQSQLLLEVLLNKYFTETKSYFYENTILDAQLKIEEQLLNEPKEDYRKKLIDLKLNLNEEEYDEEIYVRGGVFKRTIPKIYNYSCCVSGMRVETTKNIQMIDACHIVPFSVSNDDTIQNGLSLSPNLHRAFDRGLITINNEYLVRISPIVKNNDSKWSISQFEGVRITLPTNEKWFPSLESLSWHNKEVFIL